MSKHGVLFCSALCVVALILAPACTKTFDDPDQAFIDIMNELTACVPEAVEDCPKAIETVVDCVQNKQSDMRAIQKQIQKNVQAMSPDELDEYRQGKEMEIREAMEGFIQAIKSFADECPRFKSSANSISRTWTRVERAIDNEK